MWLTYSVIMKYATKKNSLSTLALPLHCLVELELLVIFPIKELELNYIKTVVK